MMNQCFSQLVMYSVDSARGAPFNPVVNPVMESVRLALESAFLHGGMVSLVAKDASGIYLRELSMRSLPGQYQMSFINYAEDPKNRLMDWWESGHASFRGYVQFGDDDRDSRMVSSDLNVAMNVFEEFLEQGALSESIVQFRSIWNPKS